MLSKTPEQLIAEAEKKKKSWFRKQEALEDAAECYQQAANKYKISRNFIEAGKAYESAAECLLALKPPPFDAASQYLEAAKMYKLVSVEGLLSSSFQALNVLVRRVFAIPRKSYIN